MADGSTSSPQDDLKDSIKQNAEGPRQAGADGVNVQQHSLDAQIAADRHVPGQRPPAR